jgi:RimJ/RimL family protein N-acetyltransferase
MPDPDARSPPVRYIEAGFDQRGYGLWALEVRATGEFIGFTGLDIPSFEAHVTLAVEVAWRLAPGLCDQGWRAITPSWKREIVCPATFCI